MNKAYHDKFKRRVRLQKLQCRLQDFWSVIGLRPRLLCAFLLVSLIPLLVLFFTLYHISKSSTLDLIEANLTQIVDVQQRRLNLELDRLLEHLHLVASRTQMRISLRAYIQTREDEHLKLLNRILNDALGSMENFVGVWIRNPDDALVTGIFDESGDGSMGLPPPVWRGKTVDLQVQWRQDGTPQVWVNGPLYLENEQIGSIHLLFNISSLYEVLKDFSCAQSGGETVLLLRDTDQQIKLLGSYCPVHGDTNKQFYQMFESPALYQEIAAKSSGAVPARHNGQIVILRQLDHGFGDVLVHISPVTVADIFWSQIRYLLLMTLLALALVVWMAYGLTRMIVRPMRELTKATSIMRYGSTDVRIKERFWGEFADLTRSFNRAMQMLSRRTRELNREIEARRRSQEKLVDMANTDILTGLINRRFFMEKLRETLSSPGREHQPAALLYLDLDDFKPINDRMGHEAGDLVLQVVAGRIRHLLREGDMAARLGGDEFALLLMKSSSHNLDPNMVARRVEEQLTMPMTIKNQVVRVGCSIGVVRLSPGDDPQDVLNRADQDMYRVKNARRAKD